MTTAVPSDSQDTLMKVWQTARNEAETAKRLLGEAQTHFNKCSDTERSVWMELKDAETHGTSKKF